MPVLLLALHLWHAPLAPSYDARLHLLPSIALRALPVGAVTPLDARPALPSTAEYLLYETGGAVVAFLVGQAIIAGIEAGLVLGVDAIGFSSGGALSALMVVAGITLGVVDLGSFPMLMVLGAHWVSTALGFADVGVGGGIVGAYAGSFAGMVLVSLALLFEAAAIPGINTTTGSGLNSISAFAWTAILGSLAVPILGGLGASIGQHLGVQPATTAAPTKPSLPDSPEFLPPPRAELAPPRGTSVSFTLMSVSFG